MTDDNKECRIAWLRMEWSQFQGLITTPYSLLLWSSGVSGPLERPSGELGGLSTRGVSEGQVEHPDEHGYGMQ